jgi:hypothetical protein
MDETTPALGAGGTEQLHPALATCDIAVTVAAAIRARHELDFNDIVTSPFGKTLRAA